MKKDLLISAVAGAAIVLVVGLVLLVTRATPQIAGDFAGGIQPNQLFTCNAATQSCTPVSGLPNFLVNGALSAGGTAAGNQITAIYTATTTYPANSITLSGYQNTTSTTSTVISFTASGFSVGDSCAITYAGVPTSTAFGTDGFVTAVSGGSASATITFWNGANAATTLNSSTLKATCFHAGV